MFILPVPPSSGFLINLRIETDGSPAVACSSYNEWHVIGSSNKSDVSQLALKEPFERAIF